MGMATRFKKETMKTMTSRNFRRIAGLFMIGFVLMSGIGCGSTKVSTETNASVGQQLLDLEKAHKEGVISDKEYQRLRKALVKDND
jgi:hypothetical protein